MFFSLPENNWLPDSEVENAWPELYLGEFRFLKLYSIGISLMIWSSSDLLDESSSSDILFWLLIELHLECDD